MKDELPLQPDPQEQDSQPGVYNTFGRSRPSSSDEFISSAPITSVAPLVETEVEPSTSSLSSVSDSTPADSSFDSQPIISETSDDSTNLVAPDTTENANQELDLSSESIAATAPLAATPVAPIVSQLEKPAEPQSSVFGGTIPPAKKSNRKKFIVIGALIGVFALLGGGTVAAYNLWYQNPDKVLSDALVNALKAKTVSYSGSFDLAYKDTGLSGGSASEAPKFNISIEGKNAANAGEIIVTLSTKYNGEEYKVSGTGLVDKNADIFIKANDVKKMLQSAPEKSGYKYDELPSYYTAIIDKLDNKWIRISNDDVKAFSDDYSKNQTCLEDTFKKLQNDKGLSKELFNTYKDNKFIVVEEKLPAQNGSLGYVIDVDEPKSKSFAKAADETKFTKELQKCDESFKFSSNLSISSDDSSTNTKVELWVDRWSHQLTKASISGNDDTSDARLVFKPKFNESVSVQTPKDFIALKELKADIEDAYAQYMADMLNDSSQLNGTVTEESLFGTANEQKL